MSNGKRITDKYRNGNGKVSVANAIGAESFGFAGAEVASMATSLGVIAVADTLIPEKLMKNVSKAVGKVCIEPFLEQIEKGMGAVCKLDECKADEKLSREERAENLARTMMIFGAAYISSMKMKVWTRRVANHHMGFHEELPKQLAKDAPLLDKVMHEVMFWKKWSPYEQMIIAADEGVHIGSLFLLNNQLAPYTDDMIRSTTGILEKTMGWSHKKSHEVATTAWVWEAPNLLGLMAGMGAIAGKHKYGWPLRHEPRTHVEKVTESVHAAAPSISAGS